MKRLLALTIVLVMTGCTAVRPPHPTPAAEPTVPTLYDTQRRITEYIDSGRYEADFARVVAGATAWLEERAPKAQRPAIVLDIDETSLSNWQAYRLNEWARILGGDCDLEHGPCGIRKWQGMGRGVALAPTRKLVERAHALGVAVFFVTGRPPELRASTERNLREQGYTFEGVVLLPKGGRFASAVDFKAAERRKLSEQGYTILLSMGDQQSDLDGGYAERTFKLPNPVYFLP
jgi:predicted secreted acid phosphatase